MFVTATDYETDFADLCVSCKIKWGSMGDWTEAEIAAIADRLRGARVAAGFPKAAEAVRRFGWAYSRYMNYENGERAIPPKQAVLFAAAYRVSVDYLYFGENQLSQTQSLAPIMTFPVRRIPLLFLADIAVLTCIASGSEPMHSTTILVSSESKLPPRAIFIEVADRSMSNFKEQVSFEPGDKVLIELDAQPQPSDFVLALVKSEKTALFRRYREVSIAGGQVVAELVPLNSNFRTVRLCSDNPGSIIGVCRQLHRIRNL